MAYEIKRPKLNEEKLRGFLLKEQVAVHCRTKNHALLFLNYCYHVGVKWDVRHANSTHTNYRRYGKNTCYRHDTDGSLVYSGTDFYERNDYEIIEFEDLLLEE